MAEEDEEEVYFPDQVGIVAEVVSASVVAEELEACFPVVQWDDVTPGKRGNPVLEV